MNIQELRQKTPGVKKVIHFNNAGASLMSQEVYDRQLQYLNEELLFGGYEMAARYKDEINSFYKETARLLNAEEEEIAFADSATVAWLRAFHSIPFKKGDEILTTMAEYASNYIAFLVAKEKSGIDIKVAPSNDQGEVDVQALRKMITPKCKLISVSHMPTNGGLINPIEEIGQIAAEHGIYYLVDACQSAGQYPLNVKKIKCDFLTATGRKYLRGPRGTGFLYVNKKIVNDLIPDSLDLHSAEWVNNNRYQMRPDAKKFETWESNLAAKIGLKVAISQVNSIGIDNIWNRVTDLGSYLRNELPKVPSVNVEDLGSVNSGIVTFKSNKKSAEQIKKYLNLNSINTSVSIKSGTLLDMHSRDIDNLVRASVHYYNTNEEIDIFVKTLSKYLE